MSTQIPRVYVVGPDGQGIGGMWLPYRYEGDRWWQAPPHADYFESLVVTEDGLMLRYFKSRQPEITGSDTCGDLFDAASHAVECSATEAVEWLNRWGHTPPEDLVALAAEAPNAPIATSAASGHLLFEDIQDIPDGKREALRKRLERWRKLHEDDCIASEENPSTGKRRWAYPATIVEKMKVSLSSVKRPS